MKKVLSVSLGSPTRDHKVETEILGEKFLIERLGTGGDIKKAIEIIKKYDGKVDAFGMGGINLFLSVDSKKYMLRSALPIEKAALKTPIVDGTGLKNTLERWVIDYLNKEEIINFKDKKILITSAIDRFGLAESIEKTGASVIYGDVFYALGIPYFLKSLSSLKKLAKVLLPIVRHLPFKVLYPTGEKQDKKEKGNNTINKIFNSVDIIAGDFLYIQEYMPKRLDNKIIITNTLTKENVESLKEKGVSLLITTTPEFNGRSFGTNVIEAVIISFVKNKYKEDKTIDYVSLLKKINFSPRIIYLNDEYKKLKVGI